MTFGKAFMELVKQLTPEQALQLGLLVKQLEEQMK